MRLRRGLNIIFGDVGTGKTTLSRTFLQMFTEEDNYIFHMVLDPDYNSELQFLSSLVKMFGIAPHFKSALDFKEAMEKYLFQKGVEENKTIILIIDEAQKISRENIEVLRTLLNYETNEYKLLQLILMAQVELLGRIKHIHNFMDRAALKYTINPLDEEETGQMIEFRLKQAGYNNQTGIFSAEAIRIIYRHTQGYPRRIAMLCHNALEEIVMQGRKEVDAKIVKYLIEREIKTTDEK